MYAIDFASSNADDLRDDAVGYRRFALCRLGGVEDSCCCFYCCESALGGLTCLGRRCGVSSSWFCHDSFLSHSQWVQTTFLLCVQRGYVCSKYTMLGNTMHGQNTLCLCAPYVCHERLVKPHDGEAVRVDPSGQGED